MSEALPQRDANAALKTAVGAFWNEAACGETYAVGETRRAQLEAHAQTRYLLEPYIHEFARFESAAGMDVLEIGVGLGADHLEWARARPRTLHGIDLSARSVEATKERIELFGATSQLEVADAERLPFDDGSFSIVYSWGVLHHSPDTAAAVREVYRVLRPGGRAAVMIYQRHSVVGLLLWIRYALLTGHPDRSLDEIYARHLESPGTKAYTADEARVLFGQFSSVRTSIRLSVGDLMEGAAGQRHQGWMLRLARAVWPRAIIRRFFSQRGLFLLIDATK